MVLCKHLPLNFGPERVIHKVGQATVSADSRFSGISLMIVECLAWASLNLGFLRQLTLGTEQS